MKVVVFAALIAAAAAQTASSCGATVTSSWCETNCGDDSALLITEVEAQSISTCNVTKACGAACSGLSSSRSSRLREAAIAQTSQTATATITTTDAAAASSLVTAIRQGLISGIDPAATIGVVVNGSPVPVTGPLPLAVPVPNINIQSSYLTTGVGPCAAITCASDCTGGTLSDTYTTTCSCTTCTARQTTSVYSLASSWCSQQGFTSQADYTSCAATVANSWSCYLSNTGDAQVRSDLANGNYNYVPPTYQGANTQATQTMGTCDDGSKKGLLGLLGLLGLIPLLLCLLLICCCCLRRSKKEQDVHFATFDPSASHVPVTSQYDVPVACDVPLGGSVIQA